jgi:predicted SAM-dependent methyltransferase
MLKELLKMVLPKSLRLALRSLNKYTRYTYRRFAIMVPVYRNKPMKIIVGAALTYQKGWCSTNEQWLDVTKSQDWQRVFKGKVLLTNVVSEHVFEHLTLEESREALRLIAAHMKVGGRLRIAVPDGFHPDPVYLRHVGINGLGADASDHKQLLTMESLTELLKGAGFIAQPLEGYCADGTLTQVPFDTADGLILRSRSNPINIVGKMDWDFIDANTSLIVDGVKA